MAGVLVLAGCGVAASARLGEELAAADVVAGDPELVRRQAEALGVRPAGRRVAYDTAGGGPAGAVEEELARELAQGARVLLVGGAELVGHRLVATAVSLGCGVTAVPGPSAAVTALAVSGLPVERFCVEGVLPADAGQRAARLAELAAEQRTLVFPAGQPPGVVAALAEAFGGERRAALCADAGCTVVRRGRLAELAAWAATTDRAAVAGLTLVVAGAEAPAGAAGAAVDDAELARRVAAREATGERRKSAIAAVAREAGVPKRRVFDAVVAAKNAAAHEPPHRDEERDEGKEGDEVAGGEAVDEAGGAG